MEIKHGVRLAGIAPEMALAAVVVDSVFRDYGLGCVITSVTDSDHGTGSLHYCGMAFDLRRRHITDDDLLRQIMAELKRRLGPDFDVVLEPTHIHVEYDPK